jgi:hypothetical protein
VRLARRFPAEAHCEPTAILTNDMCSATSQGIGARLVLRLPRCLPAQRVELRPATRTIRADDLLNRIFSTFCIGK